MATLLSSIETQVRRHLKELGTLSTPATPTITPNGVTGATTYTYKIVALHRHGTSEAGSAGSTATGNATLSSSNFNRITWTATTNATAYQIFRTVGGATTGLIGTVGAVLQFDDTGLTGDNNTAPTTNTSGGSFWSSDELIDICNKGIKDLWGGIVDLNQEHFLTVDVTNVSLAADGTQLTGVPTDVFRVYIIEPRDTTVSPGLYTLFEPRDYNAWEFINARAKTSQDTSGGLTVYYCMTSAGAPVAAPVVLTAPKISTAMNLRFVYIPSPAAVTSSGNNPIPGESDQALIAYTVAFARAKEREARDPDPAWIATYSTEKKNVMARLSPRQNQEIEVVEDLFGAWW